MPKYIQPHQRLFSWEKHEYGYLVGLFYSIPGVSGSAFNEYVDFDIDFKGVVRSKISRVHVKVKKNGREYNSLKKWFLPDYGWPEKPSKASSLLTSEKNQLIKFVKEQRIDHGLLYIEVHVLTNRNTEISSEKNKQMMPSSKQQRLYTRIKPSIIFI